MSSKWFVNKRNIIFILLGLGLTAAFYARFGNFIKPLIFIAVVLSFSILYSVLFNSSKVNTNQGSYYDLSNNEKLESIYSIVDKINKRIQ